MSDGRQFANLLVALDDPRFGAREIHHEIEERAREGVVVERELRAPDRLLAWIDDEFGGAWSSEVARSSVWYARDAHDNYLGFAAYDDRTSPYRWLRAWHERPDVGIFGPFGVHATARGNGLGGILLRASMFGLAERGYRSALIGAAGEQLEAFYAREAGAIVAERFSSRSDAPPMRALVLASGRGSNFEAAARDASLPMEMVGLIVNDAKAPALERARDAGVPSRAVVWDRVDEGRAEFDARVMVEAAAFEPDVVLMLGWMHVLPAAFVDAFACINLHPAFLPLDPRADTVALPDGTSSRVYRGAHAVDEALDDGVRWIGASVHRASAEFDRGEVLMRAPLTVVPGETREGLNERLHGLEQRLVAGAIRRLDWER